MVAATATKQGLDAAGFLLLAEGHLVKAIEQISDRPQTKKLGRARTEALYARNYTRLALRALAEEKEERCPN